MRSFHHAIEAYKSRGELAARGVSVSAWADWWGFKMIRWITSNPSTSSLPLLARPHRGLIRGREVLLSNRQTALLARYRARCPERPAPPSRSAVDHSATRIERTALAARGRDS